MTLFSQFWKFKPDIFSGLTLALFSVPGSMAYAKLAGVHPIYGLYAGMVPTIVAALTTGSALMVSSVTSAIAITTYSILEFSNIEPSNREHAVFTLTFLMGIMMICLGVFRIGKFVDLVSKSVMTGFIAGCSCLIVIGELNSLVGLPEARGKKITIFFDWIAHVSHWNPISTMIGLGSIFLMILFEKTSIVRKFSGILVLLLFTSIVHISNWKISLVGDISTITSHLPQLVLPDPTLFSKLFLGGISLTLVALIQGAGVNKILGHANHSTDFIGEGLGNILGSFFQSMGTGGSLTRTGVSVESGSKSRLAAISSGIWLFFIVLFAGPLIDYIPLPTIAGVLCVIAVQILISRVSDIKMILTHFSSSFVMVITFLSALFIPLQWTLFIGIGFEYFMKWVFKVNLH